MTIAFTLEGRDLTHYWWYVLWHRWLFLLGSIGPVSVLLLSIFVLGGLLPGYERRGPDWPPFAITVVLWVLTVTTIPRMLTVAAIKRPGSVGSHQVTISPTGVHERTTVSDIYIAWTLIQAIEHSDACIFIFMPNGTHVIPIRAFPDMDEAQRFWDAARQFWQAGKETVPGHVEAA